VWSVPMTNDHTPVADAAVSATCKNTGLTEGSHCSVCNKVLVAQTVIDKKKHTFTDFECTVCGYLQASEGLEFTPNSTGYAVSGLGTFSGDILIIPSTYNGKPVTEILQSAISPRFTVRKIVIPSSIKNVDYMSISVLNFCIIDLRANAQVEESAMDCMGGCEVINRASKNISDIIFSGKTVNAPYIINNTNKQMLTYTDEGLGFILYQGVYYLCDYKGNASSLALPESYNGSKYVIATRCFLNSDKISEVILGTGVTLIGEAAFSSSTLTKIDLTGNVTELPPACFMNCKKLTSVVIPDNITTINNQCFYGSSLNNITIGKNVKIIGHSVFYSCSNLDTLYFNAVNCEETDSLQWVRKVVIGSSVQKIPSNFMKMNTYLKSVIFEENSSCKSIGECAFEKTSITEIILPRSITHIYDSFTNCAELTNINILCDNLQYSEQAFYECGSNGDGIVITVSSDVTVLPSGFLKDCNIKTLVFDSGSKCKTISKDFCNSKLSNVTLPAAMESFDVSSFDLKTLSFEEGNEHYTFKDSCLIALKESKLVAVLDENYIIPEYVTTVAKGAFYRSGAKHIYIPDTVLTMEDGSLCCPSVESISLPFIGTDRKTPKKLLELFGSDVQYGWIEINLNSGTTRHERYYVPPKFSKLTVRGSSVDGLVGLSMLKEIRISKTVGSIYPTAFKDCKNLTNIYFGGTQEQWDDLKASGWMTYVTMNVNVTLNAEIDA